MASEKRWYEQPGPVFALLAAGIVGLFLFSTLWRTFRYYQSFRSGKQVMIPQFEQRFTKAGSRSSPGAAVVENLATEKAPSIGKKDAKITIVEFGDYECPYSREAYPAIRAIAAEHPDTVRYLWRDFPLETIHPRARDAAVAASCAEREGKFWQMHDALFLHPDALERQDILGYAQGIGLTMSAFSRCLDTGGDTARIEEDIKAGSDAGVAGTPTFFINGVRVEGAIPYDILKTIVENLSS